jgi:predicted RNase H-like HicB family nuclease
MLNDYTAVIFQYEGWYVGFVKELPGAHSQARTIEEIRENLKEAIQMVVRSNYTHSLDGYKEIIEETVSVNI